MNAPRGLGTWVVILALGSLPGSLAWAADDPDPKWAEATRLSTAHEFEKAERFFDELLKKDRKDGRLHFDAGYNLLRRADATDDDKKAKKIRKKGRALIVKAKALGYVDALIELCLESSLLDGTKINAPVLSHHDAAEAAMQAGEKAFAKGDWAAALKSYEDALTHDPQNYNATLYVGDVHFNRGDLDQAADWFRRATRIDPNRETAHRYWGDVLRKQEKYNDALWHYIDAVVAEPYSRLSRQMLEKYSLGLGMKWRERSTKLPYTPVETAKGQAEVKLNPDSGPLVLLYGMMCAQWRTEEFAKHYGTESPRRTLREEMNALTAMQEMATSLKADDPTQLEPWADGFATLDAIIAADLLPPFVLLDRVDRDLALDYANYRIVDREGIRRYIALFWCGLDLADENDGPAPPSGESPAPSGPGT